MTRRRRALVLIAFLVIVVIALPYAIWHPRRLNHAGFQSIENGMTQAEVEQLLGGPPGVYYPTYLGAGQTMSDEGYDVPDATEMLWYDDKARYEVWFDDQWRVVGKHQRSSWTATALCCRLSAMMHGLKEPSPLKPRRYSRTPAEPGKPVTALLG
jgi:hypothetical protein